ncbi:MAG: flagellar hook-length control protein FliK, partial [Gemmobacter sp.]
ATRPAAVPAEAPPAPAWTPAATPDALPDAMAAAGTEAPTTREGPGRADPLPRISLAPDQAAALRPEAARQLAAIGIARMPEGAEIRLAPDELGAVRLQVTLEGDVLRVAISAERPETLDLMRRHAPELAAEFRALGYGGAAFSFDRATDQHPTDAPRPPDPDAAAAEAAPAAIGLAAARRAASAVGTALDIRI